MKPEQILNADLLDILFEHRNKDYGAYTLRRGYDRRLLMGLLSMLLVAAIFVVVNFVKMKSTGEAIAELIPPDSKLTEVEILSPPKPPEAPKQQQKAASIQYVVPVISNRVETDVPETAEIAKEVEVSTVTNEGPPMAPSAPVGNDNITAPAAVEPEPEPAVLHRAEVMPEFPGGEAAMKRFMQKNLRFDFDNMEPGSRVEIRCRFVVDKEGKVNGIEIYKSGGRSEFDKEVSRVVGKMPDWKPGSQNGRKVAVYFTLPVVVEVPEQ